MHTYEISVIGALSGPWRDAFGGLEVRTEYGVTRMVGRLDQAGLYGVLIRVQSLALELLEVRRIAPVDSSRVQANPRWSGSVAPQ